MEPSQLNYLALTCGIAREWTRMMDDEKAARSAAAGNRCKARVSKNDSSAGANVIYLRDVLRRGREQRSSVGG
ncbi:hypothetical protein ACDJ03_10330 [Xanthomonas axonopodis pv. nakataecorchori]|uniref:hypothetical protein n=1 Tax=Xanthomonas axonopodis TaxID=53413 RepID=UPI0035306D6D